MLKTLPSIMLNMEDEQRYLSATESVKTWNAKMMAERKLRQPYLDSTTGLAQSNCHLWMSYLERQPGIKEGQVFSYPAKRWRKKKRVMQKMESLVQGQNLSSLLSSDTYESNADIDPLVAVKKTSMDVIDKWYSAAPNYEEIDEFDFEDLDDPYGDDSDFEDFGSKKKRKKKEGTGTRGGRRGRNDDCEKPFACELCPSRYKAKQGLEYHMVHAHNMGKDREPVNAVSAALAFNPPQPVSSDSNSMPSIPLPVTKVKSKGQTPNDYCDFCLGDASLNKKSKEPEEMVSCADCGRSGHPTCLQFTDNMKVSVKKYPWQCIECKSCGLCGTSENDDQLLFCDDCDRGYHMYCLSPPLTEPPEGNWSCRLCIQEFHGGIKPDWMS